MKIKNKVFIGLIGATILGTCASVNAATPVTVVNELPNEVTRKVAYKFVKDVNDDQNLSQINYNSDSTTSGTYEYILYCTDRNNETINNETLTKDAKMDYGIAYILRNSYPTKKIISGVSAAFSLNGVNGGTTPAYCSTMADTMMNVYITQNAIWEYQGTASASNLTSKSLKFQDQLGSGESSCDKITYNGATLTGSILYNQYIKSLVQGAKSVSDPADSAAITLSNVNKWTLEDGKYKSDLISVNLASNELTGFNNGSVKLENAPSGTQMFTESGTEITGGGSIQSGTKLYITVPESEVKSGKANFTLTASGDATYYAAYKYVDKVNNHQPSVLVGPETKPISASLALTIVPDTASVISRSIYIVGFIILLSGAGLIYANVKPKNEEA